MNTPRWFYAVLAGCAVILTVAASLALLGSIEKGRYQLLGEQIFDTRNGNVCFSVTQFSLRRETLTEKIDRLERERETGVSSAEARGKCFDKNANLIRP